ncbi:MAG: hypothetical protein DRO67_07170 [Candidatus Asgardarchaeum californiense]|nr:MAG: hypothetical protein DRO67_07170 [Candidatus Asgardarchaeum californiense]
MRYLKQLVILLISSILIAGIVVILINISEQDSSTEDLKDYYESHYTCYTDDFVPVAQDFKKIKQLFIEGYNISEIRMWLFSYVSDGYVIYGIMIEPSENGTYPIIIANHGGVKGIPEHTLSWNIELAKRGYVVFISSYRGEYLILDDMGKSIKIVDEYNNTVNPLSGGPICGYDEVHDVLNLIECAKTLKNTYSDKIGVYGSSHGGLLTLLTLERSADVKCGVEFYGVISQIRQYIRYLDDPASASWDIYPTEFRTMSQEEQLDYIHKADPMLCVEKINAPLLVMVGDQDSDSIVEGHQDLIKLMEAYPNKIFEYKFYDGEGHNFNYWSGNTEPNQNQLDSWNRMISFFETYL